MTHRPRRLTTRARATRAGTAIAVLIVVCTLTFPAPVGALILNFDGTLLTDDAFYQGNPVIGAGGVFWRDMRSGTLDIYRYDWELETGVPICTVAGDQADLETNGDYVIWRDPRNGNPDIYGYDLVTETEFPICVNTAAQYAPDIYERYVVWHDERNGNSDIYGYDLLLDQEFPICVAAGIQRYPAVWGDVFVWLDYRTNPNGDIWSWDASVGGQPMPLITNNNLKASLDICQEWVVYSENDGALESEVRAYNLSTDVNRTIYSGPSQQRYPRIDGDWVVFENLQPGEPDIEFYDILNDTFAVAWGDTNTSWEPDIHHGTVVNRQGSSGSAEIAIGGPSWSHDTQEIWGSTRYQTAAAIALAAFPQGADTVLIATGENFPDALGAAALAGQENIPILLTDGDVLSPECKDAIIDLGVDEDVWIVGGESAISEAVVTEIVNTIAADIDPPRRVSGDDRYGTALAIADAISGGTGGLDEPYGFVATGLNYPDALAASAISYALDIPIYLVPGTSIPTATMDQMEVDGVTIPVILGGTSAVHVDVETALKARFGDDNVYRVWGDNRYQTAYEISQWAKDALDFGMSGACVATGESFPDALAGGQLAGARYAPMILTASNQLSLAAQDFCTGNEMEVRYITILGGPVAISDPVRTALASFLH